MNYYIEKHNMEIILDALDALHNNIKYGLEYPYTLEDIDLLAQSLENSGEEAWDMK
jgi:hypothetical protein